MAGWAKIDEVPFDFERRRVSVLVEQRRAARMLVVKGAPEDILRLSSRYEGAAEATPRRSTTPRGRCPGRALSATLAARASACWAIAWREEAAGSPSHAAVGDEPDLVFAGFAAFLDPPKASAGAAIAGPGAKRHRRSRS